MNEKTNMCTGEPVYIIVIARAFVASIFATTFYSIWRDFGRNFSTAIYIGKS